MGFQFDYRGLQIFLIFMSPISSTEFFMLHIHSLPFTIFFSPTQQESYRSVKIYQVFQINSLNLTTLVSHDHTQPNPRKCSSLLY